MESCEGGLAVRLWELVFGFYCNTVHVNTVQRSFVNQFLIATTNS